MLGRQQASCLERSADVRNRHVVLDRRHDGLGVCSQCGRVRIAHCGYRQLVAVPENPLFLAPPHVVLKAEIMRLLHSEQLGSWRQRSTAVSV